MSTPLQNTAHQCSVAVSTHLLNRAIYDALCIVTGCLISIPTEYLLVLSGIPPAELHHKTATLSLVCRSLDPRHTLYNYINRPMSILSQKINLSSKCKTCWPTTPMLQHGSIIREKRNRQKHLKSSLFCYQCRTHSNWSRVQTMSFLYWH